MVRINLQPLTHAKVGKRHTVVLDLGSLEIGELRLAYLKGELEFTRVTDGILMEGTLKTEVETECIRCLEPFFEPILIACEDTISLPGTEITPERPVRVSDDGWVDLTPLIREYLWLGMPISPVCSPDCGGLCAQCGGHIARGECVCTDEEPIDPRWEALRSLLDEES